MAQLKVLFLVLLEKVSREMGECYYKFETNVGSGHGLLVVNIQLSSGVSEKSNKYNIIVHLKKLTFVGNMVRGFAAVGKEYLYMLFQIFRE